MTRLLPLIIVLLLTGLFLSAGCTSLLDEDATANTTTDQPAPASYRVTIAQPDAKAGLLHMDSDVYNTGEVVEFVVTNNALLPLECTNTPPDFRVIFQTPSGRWATKMGPEVPVRGNTSFLKKDESTPVYRFVSTGWEPGRYRIVSDCGVEREFLVRALPTPVPTTTPCPVPNSTNTTAPWIRIDPIEEQVAGQPFTISGTTSFPAGTELFYAIFSVQEGPQKSSLRKEGGFSTTVEAGSCGVNTWQARGEIQATGEFFIGIEDRERTATAIKRFSVQTG